MLAMPRTASPTISGSTLLLAAVLAGTPGCGKSQPQSGHVLDEAMRANRPPASMPGADDDYFDAMDGGIAVTREERMGRNMWLVWTGGNDRFWDTISATSFDTLDFLKTLSSHPTNTLYS